MRWDNPLKIYAYSLPATGITQTARIGTVICASSGVNPLARVLLWTRALITYASVPPHRWSELRINWKLNAGIAVLTFAPFSMRWIRINELEKGRVQINKAKPNNWPFKYGVKPLIFLKRMRRKFEIVWAKLYFMKSLASQKKNFSSFGLFEIGD